MCGVPLKKIKVYSTLAYVPYVIIIVPKAGLRGQKWKQKQDEKGRERLYIFWGSTVFAYMNPDLVKVITPCIFVLSYPTLVVGR